MERKRGKCRDCKNIKKAIDRQHFGCVKKHIQSVIEINVDHTGCMGANAIDVCRDEGLRRWRQTVTQGRR